MIIFSFVVFTPNIFFGIMMIGAITIAYLFRNKKDLLKERTKPGPGMKWWDKIFWVFHALSYFGLFTVGILDGGRYLWTGEIPIYIYLIAYIIFLSSYILIVWAMYVNAFFSSVVRILEDKTLQKELEGYKQYAKKVRFRLIPWIW